MISYIWLAAIIVFLAMEASTVSLVSIWFAAGAIVALLLSLMKASFVVQVVLFLIVSTAGLMALRPLARKYFTPNISKTNVDSMIGQTGYVLIEISNERATGRVKIGSMEWAARSSDGSSIPEGTLIRADKVEGVKVFVTPLTDNK